MAVHSGFADKENPSQIVATGNIVRVSHVSCVNPPAGGNATIVTIKSGGSGGTTVWQGSTELTNGNGGSSHSFPVPLPVLDGLYVSVNGATNAKGYVVYSIDGEGN